MLTFVILCAYHPFDPTGGARDEEMLANIQLCKYNFQDPAWDVVSPAAKDLITRLLVANPKQRLTASQVLEHRWLRDADMNVSQRKLELGEALQRYRDNMRRKMKASLVATLASVSMLQSVTGRKWSATCATDGSPTATSARASLTGRPILAALDTAAATGGETSTTELGSPSAAIDVPTAIAAELPNSTAHTPPEVATPAACGLPPTKNSGSQSGGPTSISSQILPVIE